MHICIDLGSDNFREFLKDFIKSGGMKVCYGAKDLLIVLLKFLDNTEYCQQYCK